MEAAEELLAKSQVYTLLSQAYCSPTDSLLKGGFVESLREAFHTLKINLFDREIEKMGANLEMLEDFTDLAVEYTRLFRGPVKAEAYPYESMYIDGEIMGESTLDVVKRYSKAGVAVSKDFKDLPDHISAQLEFMSYLCTRELQVQEKGDFDEALRLKLMRQSFLKDHLAMWVPDFADSIIKNAKSPFYFSLAEVTKRFIHLETK